MDVSNIDEDSKKILIQDINLRIGSEINDLANAYELENELMRKKINLQSSVSSISLFFVSNKQYLSSIFVS